jgi:hypothetical protein
MLSLVLGYSLLRIPVSCAPCRNNIMSSTWGVIVLNFASVFFRKKLWWHNLYIILYGSSFHLISVDKKLPFVTYSTHWGLPLCVLNQKIIAGIFLTALTLVYSDSKLLYSLDLYDLLLPYFDDNFNILKPNITYSELSSQCKRPWLISLVSPSKSSPAYFMRENNHGYIIDVCSL